VFKRYREILDFLRCKRKTANAASFDSKIGRRDLTESVRRLSIGNENKMSLSETFLRN